MLYDEAEVLRICKKYGIETVKKEGYPLYMGQEMDETFSIAEIMYKPVEVFVEPIISSSKSVQLSMTVSKNNTQSCNFYNSTMVDVFSYDVEADNKNTSTIPCDIQNKYAA